MDLLEKKKKAAAIAVSIYMLSDDNANEVVCNWSKMGKNRRFAEKQLLFSYNNAKWIRIF